jgi:hypothetical protein
MIPGNGYGHTILDFKYAGMPDGTGEIRITFRESSWSRTSPNTAYRLRCNSTVEYAQVRAPDFSESSDSGNGEAFSQHPFREFAV